jgi:hypothetical protein
MSNEEAAEPEQGCSSSSPEGIDSDLLRLLSISDKNWIRSLSHSELDYFSSKAEEGTLPKLRCTSCMNTAKDVSIQVRSINTRPPKRIVFVSNY